MSASDENMRELSGAVPKQGSAQTTSESGSEASSSDGASTSFGLPSLSAPKGGGAVRGIGEKFSANAASGTASLSVPIATSPGRAGFNLGLEIHYDSGTGNGPFGEGWRLNLSAISRKTDKGVPSYVDDDESDVFVLADTEDLVRVRDGERTVGEFLVVRYRPRVEGGFARIERWSQRQTGDSHWRVTTGDNVTTVYGRSARARIADPDDRRRVFSWLIEEVRDDRGQVVRYTYKAEDGEGVLATTASEASRFVDGEFRASSQRYLKSVEYGNRIPGEPSNWLFEVIFDYGEHHESIPAPEEERAWPVREDAFSTHRPGFEVRSYRLCRRVLMFHRFEELGTTPYLVRSTNFGYHHQAHLSSLAWVDQAGYVRDEQTAGYERATLPRLDLEYTPRHVHHAVQSLECGALDGIPGGVDGAAARWVDLDGEGIPGVLVASEHGWFYKENLGAGQLAPPVLQRSLPVPMALGSGVQTLLDLDGDGQLELVQYAPPTPGYFTRTAERDWTPFMSFRELPRIDWRDPNLRFLDVDGDGVADVLVTEDEALVWYRSRGKAGFEPPVILARPKDETCGPALVFHDGTETIQLADMSGDGLVDIVRIRNGEVCYWPNLGRGRFGRKVTLDRSPWFEEEDQFDPRRVRLADLDGSGMCDVVYLGRDRVRLWFNESGNGFSEPTALALPLPHSAATISVVDLLGTGTACLVWSSRLAADGTRPLAYIDLMGGVKPHLLTRYTNGFGAETRLAYASSTSFYLRDKAEGRPWLTRLPFPVQLLARLERYDHVAGTRLVTRFHYRHGFYDGVEREYRGFAAVEQWDAETLGVRGGGLFAELGGAAESEFDVPPVHTKTWFHTGAWLDRDLKQALADEYYQGDPLAPRLVWPRLPGHLLATEEREAARALRGRMLRQEIYADDGLPEACHPYSVTEHTFDVRLLQRRDHVSHGEGHARAVFFVHTREDLALHYERRPHDPRIQHQLTLKVDAFGNVLQTVSVAYPRRAPLEPEQGRLWCTVSEAQFVNREEENWYRIGVPVGSTTRELTGLAPPASGGIFGLEALRKQADEAAHIPYEAAASGALEQRLLTRRRGLYYRDDLSGPLPLGVVESRALPYETYQQAFTVDFVAQVYGDGVTGELLARDGRYLFQDGVWWIGSARRVFSPAQFYQPVLAINPFGQHFRVRYDSHALLVTETNDPLGNRVVAENDYRVLAPSLVIDPNANRTAAAFDALGMPVRIALMGKAGDSEGDTLDDPTVRMEYDLHRFSTPERQPIHVHTFAREQHGKANPRWQESYSYRDGSGREAMRKVQAPAGDVPARTPDGSLLRDATGGIAMRHAAARWIGTGRTVFNNKGDPVKKYEPFFSDTFRYETERELVEWGVTPLLRYDPLGRLIRTDLPDGTLRRVEFDPWQQASWDANDTALESRWFRERGAPDPRGPEPTHDPRRRAAWLAAQHANTPTRVLLDSLGREFLTEADNHDPAGVYRTRREFDISGNTLAVVDARGVRTSDRQVFDMLGRMLFTRSADAGWSLTLPDVVGKTLRAWDARSHSFRYEYDELRRQTHVFVSRNGQNAALVTRLVYGEAHPSAANLNLRTRPYRTYDGAGIATNEAFDFRGNLVRSSRALAREYKVTLDWSDTSESAAESAAISQRIVATFSTTAEYDALNRIVSRVTPDGSLTRQSYNESNLLAHLEVTRADQDPQVFIESIEYDARGQRTRIGRGNGTTTSYEYDPRTFRLQRLQTGSDGERLQDLRYEYDAVGNVVQTIDRVSFGNRSEPASGLYVYDALYQLVQAEGREHPGQAPTFSDPEVLELSHPNDLQAVRRYRETYSYDPVGNLSRVAHRPIRGALGGWTREYKYAPESNRLLYTRSPEGGDEIRERYEYDNRGNMTSMPHLREMRWDHADRLASVDRRGGGDVYFVYDAAGERVRKVYEHSGLVEERIYLGGYEIYRRQRLGHEAVLLERETLHVFDTGRRIAMIETKTVDTESTVATPIPRTRYELDDALGSSVMELDDAGTVISYEEYFSYGATALSVQRRDRERSAKRYRYTGKERDEETGLYYYGARYYAAWLGRWTACDPSGAVDGFNLYRYVRGNPIGSTDPTGRLTWGEFGIGVLIAVVVVAAVVAIVVTAGAAAGPIAMGGAALAGGAEVAAVGTVAVVGTEAAIGTAAVVGTEAAIGTATAVVGTEAAIGTGVAVAGTEAAVGTGVAVAGTEATATVAAVGTEAAVGTSAAATTGAGTTGLTSAITAAQATNVGAAVSTAGLASQTPVGQQLIQEGEEVLESVAPALESEVEAVAAEGGHAATMNTWLESGATVSHSSTATAIGDDWATLENFSRSQGAAGHDVIVHGGVDAAGEVQFFVNGNFTNAQQIADAVRANPAYGGGAINLVTCYGACGPAQELSAALGGVPVNALSTAVDLNARTGLLRGWP